MLKHWLFLFHSAHIQLATVTVVILPLSANPSKPGQLIYSSHGFGICHLFSDFSEATETSVGINLLDRLIPDVFFLKYRLTLAEIQVV